SRRRHTRSKRDWRSDVCSSDLADGLLVVLVGAGLRLGAWVPVGPSVVIAGRTVRDGGRTVRVSHRAFLDALAGGLPRPGLIGSEIGRAARRGRAQTTRGEAAVR